MAPSNFPSLNIMIQIPEEMAALVYSRLPLALFSQAHSVSGETLCDRTVHCRMKVINFVKFAFLYLFINKCKGKNHKFIKDILKGHIFQATQKNLMVSYHLQDDHWSCHSIPAVLTYPGHPQRLLMMVQSYF